MTDATQPVQLIEPVALADISSEMILLKAIFVDNRIFGELGVELAEHHFADARNAAIFERTAVLIRRGEAATPEVLSGFSWAYESLQKSHIDRIVAVEVAGEPVAAAREAVARIIKASLRRHLCDLGHHLIAAASNAANDLNMHEIMEMTEAALYNIQSGHSTIREAQAFQVVARRLIGDIECLDEGET